VAPAAAPDDAAAAMDFFLQEAQVVTASRKAQKKSDSPVAIDVITKEDIAASGARNLWDLLRFRVGIDEADTNSLEGNPAELNVRGLTGEFSQSLQVLVDGRSVVSPSNSGVFWRDIPVSLEDIERIEIVRGPNAALFGANAGQGVINIITKKPVDGSTSVDLHTAYGTYGYREAQADATWGQGPVRARVSLSQAEIGSFPAADGSTNQELTDQPKDVKANLRLDIDAWKGAEVELYGGLGQEGYDQPPALGFSSGSYLGHYLMGQIHQKFGENQNLDVTLAERHDEIGLGLSSEEVQDVYDADALYHLSLMDGRLVTGLGASTRYSQVISGFLFDDGAAGQQSPVAAAPVVVPGYGVIGMTNGYPGGTDTVSEHQNRIYASENWSATEWLAVDLAASLEDSDTGGEWPAYQAALIYKPLESQQVRVSVGKSPTVPSLANVDGQMFFPVKTAYGMPAGFSVDGSQVETTQITDYEVTWSGQYFHRHFTSEITAYDMECDNLIYIPMISGSTTFIGLPQGQAGVTQESFQYANVLNAVLTGAETVLTYKPVDGTTLQFNHTYENVWTTTSDPDTDGTTPWNKMNLLGNTRLPYGFDVSAELGWVGGHNSYLVSSGESLWIPDQATLNLRLGYKPHKDVEVYLVGANLDHAYRVESADGTSQPRMYWAGVNLAFGGK
jgi:iron complex outermembrane receptor protein